MTKKIPVIFTLLLILTFYMKPVYSGDKSVSSAALNGFEFSGNVLFRSGEGGRIKLYDNVLAVSVDGPVLYYLRSVNKRWICGFIKNTSSGSEEFDIPGNYEKLYRFAGYNNIFYFLALPAIENNNLYADNLQYIRFNPDQQNHQIMDGVSDFALIQGRSVVLKNSSVNYNGNDIPLQITGNLRIAELIDSRIAVISGDVESELVDLPAGRSIYQYGKNSVPEPPDEYNVVIEFEDKIVRSGNNPEPDGSIYYQMLINGVEESRTVTGTGEAVKVIHMNLDHGIYHIIKPERWELDKIKGRYVRVNNINQPAGLKVYIPENRIIKIRFEYDGKDYRVDQSVLYK